LLQTTSAAKKRNTDLAFLIGGNDTAMDEETRAWYEAHRQAILHPPSTAVNCVVVLPFNDVPVGGRSYAARAGVGRHRRRACSSLV
jgi:hypothetical protein